LVATVAADLTTENRLIVVMSRLAWNLWVPDIRFTLGDLRVLMDQPTESIPSRNPSAWQDDMWFGGPERWRLPQGAVRAVAVAMVGILGQYSLQLPAPKTSIRSSTSRRTVPIHQHTLGLGAEELPPGQGRPDRCRSNTATAKGGPDGAGPDLVAELAQLTVDAAYLQVGFSLASRSTRARISSATPGRPRRCG
jgi:hypothetical protein